MTRDFDDIFAGVGTWTGKPRDNNAVHCAAFFIDESGQSRGTRLQLPMEPQASPGDRDCLTPGDAHNPDTAATGRSGDGDYCVRESQRLRRSGGDDTGLDGMSAG